MTKRALIIGVGGTGKSTLTILRERLEETYGQVPDGVVLLSLDTDHLRPLDEFAGTELNPQVDAVRGRDPEFQHITSPGGITMDQVFDDLRAGKTMAWMKWLEYAKLDRILSAEERTILGGAQQRRPIGRTAFFLRYAPIMTSLVGALGRMYDEAELEAGAVSREDEEKGRRLIFIVSSVAGGTGSGMFIDIANLLRHAIKQNPTWASVSMSAVIVLPDAFAGLIQQMKDPTNLKPNSYAALRELDRFMRAHSGELSYPIRYYQDEQSFTSSSVQLFDHVYLVDTSSRSGVGAFDLGKDPLMGIFPAVADFLMAHIDGAQGDAIATQRSNAGLHYFRPDGRQYSSFNVFSYIFPVDDVVESFSYRFLRELLESHFLPVADARKAGEIQRQAQEAVIGQMSAATVAGRANTNLLPNILAATRRVDAIVPRTDWEALLSLISLSEEAFVADEQYLRETLQYLKTQLVPTPESGRGESFAQGYERLFDLARDFDDRYLGLKTDPDREDSRAGGEWDQILDRYLDAHRQRSLELLDTWLLATLDERDDADELLEARLAYAEHFLLHLRERVRDFRELLENLRQEEQVDERRRRAAEDALGALAEMDRTKRGRYLPPFFTKPLQAQQRYIRAKVDQVEYALRDRLYRQVQHICETIGGERDDRGRSSVINLALQQVAQWRSTMLEVDRLLKERQRRHENDRAKKDRARVRRYATNPEIEEELYRSYVDDVHRVVLGITRETQLKGLEWARQVPDRALDYEIKTWVQERAVGSREIADKWFSGIKDLFSVIRNDVTVAERLAAGLNYNPSKFATDCQGILGEPLLRYNPNLNAYDPHKERYVFVNVGERADDRTRTFFHRAGDSFSRAQPRIEYSDKSESLVACTVLLIARGFRLEGVEQFNLEWCTEYRNKLASGYESIHLFSEEQNATEYERRLETLGEADQRLRSFAPELVVSMGEEVWLRAFARAAAYGLIQPGEYVDPDTGERRTEAYLTLRDAGGQEQRYLLSQSARVAELEPTFATLPPEPRRARLFLNALQNFVVRRVDVQNPTMHINIKQVYNAIDQREKELTQGKGDARAQRRHRIKLLQDFIGLRKDGDKPGDTDPRAWWSGALRVMKTSPDPKICDLGALMHLLLKEEIERLQTAG